jgi:hypothetical protein
MKGPVQDCSDYGLRSPVYEMDGRSSSQLMTDPDTPSTEDAQIVVPVEKRIVFFDLKIPINRRKIDLFDLNSFYDILKVTTTIIRAEHTSCDLPNFSDGGFKFVTILFFCAYKACIGMFSQDETEDFFSRFTKLRRIGFHFHPIFDKRTTRGSESSSSLYLNNTQPAAAEGIQYRMIAQSRNVDIVLSCNIQYGFFSLCFYPFSIDD